LKELFPADTTTASMPNSSSASPGKARHSASMPSAVHSSKILIGHLRKQENLRKGEKEEGDGRNYTLKNTRALMPAVKFVVSDKT
jgi:hypothetical protein